MLAECVNCGFYVSSREKFCPNCGLSAPGEPLQKDFEAERQNFTIIFAVALAFASSLIILYLRSDGKFDNLSELPGLLIGSLLLGLAFSIPAGMMLAKKSAGNESVNRFPNLKSGVTFTSIEETIAMRNYELDGKYREIETLLEHAVESGSVNVAEKLSAARERILTQIARYDLQDQKIKIIRLQNNLRPILYYSNFSSEESKILAENVSDALAEIERIRQELTNNYAIEFPETAQIEKRIFLSQLDETEQNCERMREKVLSSQAALALQNSSSLRENFEFSNHEREIGQAIEVSNIQTSLTDFSESFNRLERENERLKAEEEMRRKLSNN